MRIASFAIIISSSMVLGACGSVPNIQLTDSGTDTETGTDTGTGTETSTTDTPTTSSASGGACVPGMSVACTCSSGDAGAQACNQSGSGYLPCECEGGESNSASEAMPTTDPGTSTTTTDTGTMTDPGTSTEPDMTTDTTTDTTTEGDTTTGGLMCNDEGEEPNDDEAGAIDLGNQSCNAQPKAFAGTLAGAADVDWFQYHAVDQGCPIVGDPTASQQITASEDVRLCVFVDCDNGNPTFQCQGGATNNDSPEGLPGCCRVGGNVNFNLNCSNGPENAQIFVRVDQAPEDACVDYEVGYDFD